MKRMLGIVMLLPFWAFLSAEEPMQFASWNTPVNLGPVVNSAAYDACPTISKSGLSLFFRSNRPGGQGFDIWVSQRDSQEDGWETPANIGNTINSSSNEFCTSFSPDGHWMVFVSNRPVSAGGCGGQDLWIAHRKDKRDDFNWDTPVNLGCVVNSSANENGPAFFQNDATGELQLYFSSNRSGGLGNLDIYVISAVSDEKGTYVGQPQLVAELSTGSNDYQPVLRKDGLELFFASDRSPGSGNVDLWVSTRATTVDNWEPPVNLGQTVNSNAADFHPTLSWDGTTLIFASERGGGSGPADLYMCTRTKLHPLK
jgi:Tol biopolymer transport system component